MQLLGFEFSKRTGDGLIEVIPVSHSCPGEPSHEMLAVDGSRMATVARCREHEGGLVAHFRSGIVACIGREIRIFDAEASADTQRHDFDNLIAPLAASRSRLVSHGAVLSRNGRGLVVAAPSGTGKSTLAATALDNGYDVLSDDCCAVSRSDAATWQVHPGAPVIAPRQADGSRRRIDLPAAPASLPLAAVVIAHRGGEPALDRLSPADATVALLGNSFLLDHSPDSLRAWMQRAADLARTLPICSLTVPEGLTRIPEVFTFLDDLLP